MLRLIEDLLDFASIEAERLAITCLPHEPGKLIDETLASFEGAAEEKRLSLTAEVPADLPTVYCDRDRILQVLSNLVGNATKASASGSHIELRVESRGSELLFSVTDSGPGIREEDVTHIFDRYWRGTDAHYAGSGLGLAIARGIVAAHGGRIWAESAFGHGATFRFTVPIVGRSGGTPVREPPSLS
jgi:signal transduction histidine kinase